MSNQEAIVDRWLELCDDDSELDVVDRLTRFEFRNNMPGALMAFCDMLVVGEERVEELLEVQVAKHGHHRWKQGFSLQQLIRDWGHFNRALTEKIDEFYRELHAYPVEERSAAICCLADYFTEAVSHSVERFDNLRRAEAASLVTDLESINRQFEEVTQARGNLLRQITHDIRGGMSSITGASSYLRAAGAEPETLKEMLDILDSGVVSILEMLGALLDLSRIEAGAEERRLIALDVGQMLDALTHELQPLAREKGLNLVADGDSCLLIETDPGKVRRIAQNLLVNAIKYTQEGEIRIAWRSSEDAWTLTIEDTGPGIQNELGSVVAKELTDMDTARPAVGQEQAFACPGEGIGLAIVKQLCNLLNAGISMESEIGRGTKFTIEFPLRYES